TFLMVALLQNTQTRNDMATQHKLNAIADAIADLMTHFGEHAGADIEQDIRELRDAVGLVEKEWMSVNQKTAARAREARGMWSGSVSADEGETARATSNGAAAVLRSR